MGLELGRIRHSLPNVGGVGIGLKTRHSPPRGGWTGLEKLRHSPPCGRGMGTDVDVVGLNVKSLNTKRKGNSFSG